MQDPLPEPGASPGPQRIWCCLASLIRLSNQTGTLLLLFPTLWSLVIASRGKPPLALLIVFCLGSFLMRSAGVIMNDLADQALDRQVARTRQRPLAKGALTSRQALMFLAFLLTLACSLLWLLNPLTRALGPIALLLAGIYPFCKRFLHIPQIVLGIAFGWGTIMAWTAVTNHLALSAWLIFASTVCWAVVYDTIYAIQDISDDKQIGIKSSAIFFGSRIQPGVGIAAALMIVTLAATGILEGLGPGFYVCLMAGAGLLTYQVVRVRPSLPGDVAFGMFQQHCWIGALLLLGTFLGFMH